MIEVRNLEKQFDDKKVLNDISFDVKDGETLAIVGFSGSGKSTILKIICGLLSQNSGTVKTSDGDVAMVVQYSALFDSINVFDNIAFALTERPDLRKKYTKDELNTIVKQQLKLVGLAVIEDKYPS